MDQLIDFFLVDHFVHIIFLTGKGSGNGSQKLVAIVAGGIVATILLGVVYYFMKSWGKKDDGKP